MKKIPTIYARDEATNLRHVKDEQHPDCGWVFDGEGTATFKWNGTSVMVDSDGELWKRREVKPDRPIPPGFVEQGSADVITGKRVGWVPCDPSDSVDQWHFEGLDGQRLPPGTYELVGPKVQTNPHGFDSHRLIAHGVDYLPDVPTDFAELGQWLHGAELIENQDGDLLPGGFEGVVWHHPDGRMAKIKLRDFPEPSHTDATAPETDIATEMRI